MKKLLHILLFTLLLLMANAYLHAQSFQPLTVTGFNVDGVAENPSLGALGSTTSGLDFQSKVLYTITFRNTYTTLTAGIPDNGTITTGTYKYQLAPYNAANCLYLSNPAAPNTATAGTLTLNTPDSFAKLSVLGYSTEGAGTFAVKLNFDDGSSENAGNFTFSDWFATNSSATIVMSPIGRTNRGSSPPYSNEGFSTAFNSGSAAKFYRVDINVSCANQSKKLLSVTFTFIGGTSTDPTNPSRVCIFGMSSLPYIPITDIDTTVVNATCGQNNGSAQVTVTGGATPLTYLWSPSGQTTAKAVNLAGNTTYTCTIKDANGCSVTKQAIVSQQSAATLTATATPSAICSGQTSTLQATATGGSVSNYTWTNTTQTGATITVSPTGTTNYTVTGQDANGCNVTAQVTLNIKPTPTSTFGVSPNAICKGANTTVTYTGSANSTSTYTWNFGGGTVQSGTGAGPYTVAYNTSGNKTLTLTVVQDGCSSTATAETLTVDEPPTPSFSLSSNAVCAGQNVTITYTGGNTTSATPTWNFGTGTVQSGSNFGPYSVQYNSTGIITLSVVRGVCTATATPQTVNVTPMPAASFTADTVLGCQPFKVTFTNTSTPAASFNWNFGDNTNTTQQNPPAHIYISPGTYTVTLMAANGSCTDAATPITITVRKKPVASFTAVPGINVSTLVSNATYTFSNASTDATTYLWELGDNTTSTAVNPTYKYSLPGNIYVKLWAYNSIGCFDTITHGPYIIAPDFPIVIPNAFSPNHDGTNDKWEISGLKYYPDARVEVFNRNGQVIYNSNGYQQPWDGTYNGKDVPSGTYYYIVIGNKQKFAGWLYIIR